MSGTMKLRRVRLVTVDAPPTETTAPTLHGPSEAAAVARAILPTDREGFVVMHLDSRNRVRSVELVSVGSLDASIVHPRETFKAAILSNAASIILAHNHPSGMLEPSAEDMVMTARLVEAGELLGIPVMDHVIVTDEGFVSFKDRKLI